MEQSTQNGTRSDEAKEAVSRLSGARSFLEQKQERCRLFYSVLLPTLSVLGVAGTLAAFLFAPVWAAWAVAGLSGASVLTVLFSFLKERQIWNERVSDIGSVFHALADMPFCEQEKYLCLFAKILCAGLEIRALHLEGDVRLVLSDGEEQYELFLEDGAFRGRLDDGRQFCLPFE